MACKDINIKTFDPAMLEENGEHWTTPYDDLLFINFRRICYMQPRVCWNNYFTNDDFGNLVPVDLSVIIEWYKTQDNDL